MTREVDAAASHWTSWPWPTVSAPEQGRLSEAERDSIVRAILTPDTSCAHNMKPLMDEVERILAARLAAAPAAEAELRAAVEGLADLAREAISAVGTGGHSHWRTGGAGGPCGACEAAIERQAELSDRLRSLLAGRGDV